MLPRTLSGFGLRTAFVLLAAVGTGCASAPPADRASDFTPEPGDVVRGISSWYGPEFNGRATASGETFDMDGRTAAHRTLPFGTVLRVTNLDNGRSVKVTVNDRGPFIEGRILDLSRGAAKEIRMVKSGIAEVEIRVLSVPPAVETAGSGTLRVQAGAFREKKYAFEVVRQLEKDYPGISVYSADGWHRVQLRGISSRPRAQNLAAQLRQRGYDAVVLSP